jgi:hypothetical protein
MPDLSETLISARRMGGAEVGMILARRLHERNEAQGKYGKQG